MKSIANPVTPDMVVSKAREYLGTRYHHQGRVKGVGVDCIGLAIGVTVELGMHTADRTDYSRIPDGTTLVNTLLEHMVEVPVRDLRPADLAVFVMEKEPQHVAILSTLPDGRMGMIHSYAQARKVVEHGLDDQWRRRIVRVFRFRELDQG